MNSLVGLEEKLGIPMVFRSHSLDTMNVQILFSIRSFIVDLFQSGPKWTNTHCYT